MSIDRDKLEQITKTLSVALADRGKVIAGGWVLFRDQVMSADAPQDQVAEMQVAFYAGAQHLLGSIMAFLDPGDEPTEDDLRRMDLIAEELAAFGKAMMAVLLPTKGSA